MMGSFAYGVSSDTSDNDAYGFAIPPKEDIFPHLRGEILGFGRQINRFEQWQQHHIMDGKKQWDFTVYSIVKFFNLCMENNPNMVDALFVPQNCVLHMTSIGQSVRDNRRLFLHKGAWPKFRGYAYSQLHKMSLKQPEAGSKRDKLVKAHGFDTKFAYHIVRLIDEVEQILTTGDLDLQRNNEQLKAIRAGKWSEEQIRDFFTRKEKDLEAAHASSILPWGPDEPAIKALLLQCLERHYGPLDKAVRLIGEDTRVVDEIAKIIARARH